MKLIESRYVVTLAEDDGYIETTLQVRHRRVEHCIDTGRMYLVNHFAAGEEQWGEWEDVPFVPASER